MAEKKLFSSNLNNSNYSNNSILFNQKVKIEEHVRDNIPFKETNGIFINFCDKNSCFIMISIGNNNYKVLNINLDYVIFSNFNK